MGFLTVGIAAVLALIMPAAVARSSLGGAYLLIALLAILAVVAVTVRAWRRAPADSDSIRRPGTALVRIAVLTVLYAVIVTVVHATG